MESEPSKIQIDNRFNHKPCCLTKICFSLLSVSCVLVNITYAAEMAYSKSDNPPFLSTIYICGPIQEGDYIKFNRYVEFILKSGWLISQVQLSSLGGDTLEAMKIGRNIRELGINTNSYMSFNKILREPIKRLDGKQKKFQTCAKECSSACFLIWAAGVRRHDGFILKDRNDGPIGIHRPYFEARYFSGLSKKEADKKYGQMSNTVYDYLQEMSIPIYLIDQMFQISSQNIQYLTEETTKPLSWAPFFEEWITASCGTWPRDWFIWFLKKKDAETGGPPLTKDEEIYADFLIKKNTDYQKCYWDKLQKIQSEYYRMRY